MKFVRTFKETDKNDVTIAGGKGASLGEMTKAGFRVPEGFVITVHAYDEYIETGSSDIPEDIKKEIEDAFKKLGAEKVAVRSSATSEDSVTDAWAGQLESYLNTTEKDLIENVKKCWDSILSPRAISYRHEKGLDDQKISVAVVVQKMIQSEIAGVAFSVHPVTQDKNQIIIEAVRGFGDKLVSGEVTPDTYVISKNKKEIIENKGKHILKEEQILELANLVLKIEGHYGFPVDIEWAYADGKFYILQSRPITTLTGTIDIEVELNKLRMIRMGKRRTNIFQASLKITGWSTGLEKELGMGYEILVINSLGEQFADYKSSQELKAVIEGKDFLFAKEYVIKMASLDSSLLEKVKQNNVINYKKEFSKLFTYFFIVKHIFEHIYERSTPEERAYIEQWRNNPELFASLDLYYEKHPQNDRDEEWSWVATKGNLQFIHKNISLGKKESPETNFKDGAVIKGSTAYPGKVSGRVRVVLTKAEIDLVEDEEIIVAPMTTVDFGPVMKKASAFVTDEGGITSHAAIVARELKKPCIIGTKIATQILKTGDMVEVDADEGVIRILK